MLNLVKRAASVELSKTERLNGTNFSTWKCSIRHIIFHDKAEYVLDTPYPTEPLIRADEAARNTFECFVKDDKLARYTMLTILDPDLEIIFEEHKTAKSIFDAGTETYGTATNTYIQLLMEKI